MKNIIPFKKDVIFKTNLSEITSISLENTLSIENDTVKGEFIVSGDYKVSDRSTTVEPFELKLPFEIVIDDKYDTSSAVVDIDDFYYEIVNNNVLSVSIDVLIDKLKEKPVVELEDLKEVELVRETLDTDDTIEEVFKEEEKGEKEEEGDNMDIDLEKEELEEVKEVEKVNEVEEMELSTRDSIAEEKINSLFNQFSKDSEVYVTYNVFILRDGDTLDSIMEKYNVTEEELKKYNDLSNLQLGDKLIIPNTYERD